MAKKNPHVVPSSGGGWDVKREGAKRASSHHEKQSDAIEAARRIAQREKGELAIHGRDGKIRQKDSHGKDTHPPEG